MPSIGGLRISAPPDRAGSGGTALQLRPPRLFMNSLEKLGFCIYKMLRARNCVFRANREYLNPLHPEVRVKNEKSFILISQPQILYLKLLLYSLSPPSLLLLFLFFLVIYSFFRFAQLSSSKLKYS